MRHNHTPNQTYIFTRFTTLVQLLIGAFAMIVILQGCINLKISTPAYTYYTLAFPNDETSKSYSCPSFSTIRLEFDVPSHINTQWILRLTPTNAIDFVPHAKWQALPSELGIALLESKLQKRCVLASTIGADTTTLRIKMREMNVREIQGKDWAIISLDYALLQGQKVKKARNITEQIAIPSREQAAQVRALQQAIDSAFHTIEQNLCVDTASHTIGTALCKTPDIKP